MNSIENTKAGGEKQGRDWEEFLTPMDRLRPADKDIRWP
jgi:hypothetical protein